MAEDQAPVFQIQRIYLKDLSLEQPNSPGILLSQEQPSVDIQLALAAENVADGVIEVTVTATVTTKIQDKTVFLVEAKQAGIFEVRGVPEDQMGPLVGIACPQIVYPYLRGNVADVVQRAGFPPVHLTEINFQAMFEAQQQQLAAQQGNAATVRLLVALGADVDRANHGGRTPLYIGPSQTKPPSVRLATVPVTRIGAP